MAWVDYTEDLAPGALSDGDLIRRELPPRDERTLDRSGPARVVASLGRANDWAAYIGDSYWPWSLVYSLGGKLTEQHALQVFPRMADSGRRYRL